MGVADGASPCLLGFRDRLRMRELVPGGACGLDGLARLILVETSSLLQRVSPASPVYVTLSFEEVARVPALCPAIVHRIVFIILEILFDLGDKPHQLLTFHLLRVEIVSLCNVQMGYHILDRVCGDQVLIERYVVIVKVRRVLFEVIHNSQSGWLEPQSQLSGHRGHQGTRQTQLCQVHVFAS